MARRRDIADLSAGSLLDRLIDDGRGEAPSFARLKEGLRRDLQDLFNTRRRFLTPPPALDELERSLLTYGLEDFTNEQLDSLTFRQDFADDVERVLRASEPRIQLHEVLVVENADPLDRRLRFRILGAVDLGGERQALSFDSYLDPVEGAIVVGD
ncbi:MAG: type VI secretion system baseplate subunit TssE [Caulobacteraceae bacterium]|nr:type VI secretion system baseplate subunit TssE [Caulobacter sp.]